MPEPKREKRKPEFERFREYAAIYQEECQAVLEQEKEEMAQQMKDQIALKQSVSPQATTKSGKANKIMSTRKTTYGASAMSSSALNKMKGLSQNTMRQNYG